jgi:glycolate oxidase FAD binding subunit
VTALGTFDPEAVLEPTSPEEVTEALAEARSSGWRVVPAGSGRAMGPLPPEPPYALLSLGRLSGIDEHEPGDLTFTARPGTPLGVLAEALEPHGQWFPVDPPGGGARTLGGVVAAGLGGGLHAGYGAVRDQVLGVTLITGDGRRLRLGGRVMKNVAGFDLVRLAVGSRGRLGVVVSVSARVFPVPRDERVLVLEEREDGTFLAAARGVATAPVVPASAVLVRWGAGRGVDGPREMLVVRLHGATATVASDRAALQRAAGADLREVDPSREDPHALLARVRDAGTGGSLAFRQAGLPAELPVRWRAFRARLPGADLHADLFSGLLRGSLEEASPETVGTVRAAAAVSRRPVLFTAVEPRLRDSVTPWSGRGVDQGLTERLTSRFDPFDVLAPGRLAR